VVDRTIYLKSWERRPEEGKLLGICAGLSKKFDIEALYIRVAFVIGALIGGLGIFLYLILWLLMPRAAGSGDAVDRSGETPLSSEKKPTPAEK
jgi:phage shock protein PspC (stress-responsive transcriptional regulator)